MSDHVVAQVQETGRGLETTVRKHNGSTATPAKKRKRTRVSQACVPCRRRNVRCDGRPPACGQCVDPEEVCTWPEIDRRRKVKKAKVVSGTDAEQAPTSSREESEMEEDRQGATTAASFTGRSPSPVPSFSNTSFPSHLFNLSMPSFTAHGPQGEHDAVRGRIGDVPASSLSLPTGGNSSMAPMSALRDLSWLTSPPHFCSAQAQADSNTPFSGDGFAPGSSAMHINDSGSSSLHGNVSSFNQLLLPHDFTQTDPSTHLTSGLHDLLLQPDALDALAGQVAFLGHSSPSGTEGSAASASRTGRMNADGEDAWLGRVADEDDGAGGTEDLEVAETAQSSHEHADAIAKHYGVRAKAYKCQVKEAQQVFDTIKAVLADFGGRLDIFVANAGIPSTAGLLEDSLEAYREVVATNLDGVVYCANVVGEIFKKQGKGSFIITSSMSAHIVNVSQQQAVYKSTKAAVSHLAKSLAVEWADFARVNAISPGCIDTPISKSVPAHVKEEWFRRIPLGRDADPRELKGAYLYLAGDASTYTTGADLIVDGGYCVP